MVEEGIEGIADEEIVVAEETESIGLVVDSSGEEESGIERLLGRGGVRLLLGRGIAGGDRRERGFLRLTELTLAKWREEDKETTGTNQI